jgi:hypothetical protein
VRPSLLIISTLKRRPIIDGLFNGLSDSFQLRFEKIDTRNFANFSAIARTFTFESHDHILIDLPHRYLRKQAKHIKPFVDRLYIYEEDACQNFMPDSSWYGDFSYLYRQLPGIKIIHTGHHISKQLANENVNSFFIPKGFDSNLIYQQDKLRDIPLAFIGTFLSNTYHERYRLISYMQNHSGLKVLRTNPGKEYCDTLNRIQTFFSADCGIGEYMAKNFEAMAAGCLLIAYQQGCGEEEALGLKHKENVLLYKSKEQALELLDWVKNNPHKAQTVADNGHQYATDNFSFDALSKKLAQVILGQRT